MQVIAKYYKSTVYKQVNFSCIWMKTPVLIETDTQW